MSADLSMQARQINSTINNINSDKNLVKGISSNRCFYYPACCYRQAKENGKRSF